MHLYKVTKFIIIIIWVTTRLHLKSLRGFKVAWSSASPRRLRQPNKLDLNRVRVEVQIHFGSGLRKWEIHFSLISFWDLTISLGENFGYGSEPKWIRYVVWSGIHSPPAPLEVRDARTTASNRQQRTVPIDPISSIHFLVAIARPSEHTAFPKREGSGRWRRLQTLIPRRCRECFEPWRFASRGEPWPFHLRFLEAPLYPPPYALWSPRESSVILAMEKSLGQGRGGLGRGVRSTS